MLNCYYISKSCKITMSWIVCYRSAANSRNECYIWVLSYLKADISSFEMITNVNFIRNIFELLSCDHKSVTESQEVARNRD